ncbi:MAG: COX15/CtaA family protein [Ferruginibacter sp.]
MNEERLNKNNKQVAIWLFAGVSMIVIQVLIGGITRLTESGLSITEWKPITGALPPLNDAAWQSEFNKYRMTDQFRYVHQDFTLNDFKYIFFWEWMHRLWARLLGIVFIIGFLYFLFTKKFNRKMIFPFVLLFLLGALQGVIGWLMVKSGLVPEKFFVGHIELTTHLIAALLLLGFTLWFALSLYPGMQIPTRQKGWKFYLIFITVLVFCQVILGGFMAGLKAAQTAPTWPDINGEIVPAMLNKLSPWYKNIINNQLTIHFFHRGVAYLIVISTVLFYLKSLKMNSNILFKNFASSFFILIIIQVLLGILTVINATNKSSFIFLGVAHQFTAMLIIMNLVVLLYQVKGPNPHQYEGMS